MMTIRAEAAIGLMALASAAATGCAMRTDLTPAAKTLPGAPETAVSSIDGISMKVESDSWTGREEVAAHVTPVKVRIENDSSSDVRMDYGDFALVAPNGKRYAALPPYGVEGTVAEPVLTSSYTPLTRPGFHYENFFVAPYYAPVYPGMIPYAGVHHYWYDPTYYAHYYDYWAHIPLPTPAMLQQALPPGVIEPDGEVSGFLYFERVGMGIERVHLRADLVDADDGRRMGEIRIPFTVKREPLGG